MRREAKAEGKPGIGPHYAGTVLKFRHRVGENDHLFGSVTAKDIADALEAQRFHIERRKVQLDEPIRSLGEYEVTLRLHRDVSVPVKVIVEAE